MSAIRGAPAAAVMVATFAATTRHVGRPGEGSGDASAIGALRAITSGESSYASMNGGSYDTLDCLLSGTCVPGVRMASAYLSPDLRRVEDYRGYRLEFHSGPPVKAAPASRSPSAVERYAVVATPVSTLPNLRRSFCVDDRGVIYQTPSAITPRVQDGRCVDTATPVQ